MTQLQYTLILAVIASSALLSQLPINYIALLLVSAVTAGPLTLALMPKIRQFMLKKGIYGLDINKRGSKDQDKKIPECMGFAAAVAFMIVAMMLTPLIKGLTSSTHLTIHLATVTTILSTILLGFTDDMLELPWRYKLIFPFFIIIPFVTVYNGPTYITTIFPFQVIFGTTIELGAMYLLYSVLLSIYLTNTINIFAGINGLEVGQSIVAASLMLLYFAADLLMNGYTERYNYSAYLLLSFTATALALMKLNAYPAQIFIGDTFCYFAGIVLAIAALYGQIPIVCHWFIVPQLINFLYSTPQLFGYVACPRHRLTTYNPKDDTLIAIPSNMNLLNLSLRILGPTNQGKLCLQLLFMQILFGLVPILHLILRKKH